jgi:hypothetical protein
MVSSFFQIRRLLYPHNLLVLAILYLLAPTSRGKEIIATYEWQKLGPTDTVPAGLEIRMDLGGEGGTWVRLPPAPEEAAANEPNGQHQQQDAVLHNHKDRCGPSCKERQKERAEARRAAGFRLRGQRSSSWNFSFPNDSTSNTHTADIGVSSILFRGGIFIVALLFGVGLTTRLRTRRGNDNSSNGLHEH